MTARDRPIAMQSELAVLDLWESAAAAPPWQRDEALLRASGSADHPRELGAHNAALLALRARLFGNRMTLKSTCPACGAECEFEFDCRSLLPSPGSTDAAATIHSLSTDGREIRFRLPCAEDLQAAACEHDAAAAARALARCCVLDDAADTLSDAARAELSRRMETLDPGALLEFALRCPDCRHAWDAPIDVGETLWRELQVAAERTLLEVDALARAYGWNEAQVLALSPMRRAAYLQLAGAA